VFLHLGSNEVVYLRDVIAIMDLRAARTSRDVQQFLRGAEMENRVVNLSDGNAKSFVICEDRVYLSPISSTTLRRRTTSLYRVRQQRT